MRKIVIDLEIQDPIIHQSDWERTDLIKIACCCVYDFEESRYHVFGPNDIEHLRNLIICSDLVIGFNTNKFDLPVIFSMPERKFPDGIKTYDILAEIWKSRGLDPTIFTDEHRGFSLNSVSKYTLSKCKTGDGASAPFWFKQGNIWKVIDYCLNDVALTKELYEHIEMYGCVRTKVGTVGLKVPTILEY